MLLLSLLQDTTSNSKNCGYCGNVCRTTQSCMAGVCAEEQAVCGKAKSYNGAEGNFTYSIPIGNNGTTFNFTMTAYSIPDRFSVFVPNGTMIFSRPSEAKRTSPTKSGCICTACGGTTTLDGTETLPRPPGVSTVRVLVNGYCAGTQWQFTVGCAR
jgi:hypothetical protein